MKVLFLIVQIAAIGIILVSGRSVQENEGKRLIKTSETEPATWMTEAEIFQLIQANKGFMDVTDFTYEDSVNLNNAHIDAIPTAIRFEATVNGLISKLNTSARVEKFLIDFSNFHNRYHSSDTGVESEQWLFARVLETVENYVGSKDAMEVAHSGYRQNSIVVRLDGVNNTVKDEIVVIGAHLDSVTSGATAKAPGADDNGSGSVAILEALKAIVDSGVRLQRTVEFHWYAAEEVGLRGSQAIATSYKNDKVNVVGMLNLDVVGYHTPGIDEIAVYTDYANADLVRFVKVLSDGYLDFGRRDSICGYGCSDHASWTSSGFPAVFVAEAIDSPYMHRLTDTVDTVNLNQVNEFIKLTIGYAIEMGEPASN